MPAALLQARLKIRVICSRAYHALFMHNMLIRPTEEELENFGEPDFTIYNAGGCQGRGKASRRAEFLVAWPRLVKKGPWPIHACHDGGAQEIVEDRVGTECT